MSASRHTAVLLAALLLPSALASPRTCSAQPEKPATTTDADASHVADAAAHFRRGVRLYKDGDSAGAIVEFRRAYELAPNYRVLYNIGQTYYQLQRYADALNALRGYLSAGGTNVPAKRRASVEHDIRQLEAHVAQVEVRVNLDGATVLVDDEAVGVSPLSDPVLVSIGRRHITATREGAAPVERTVDVGAGDHVRVELELPAQPAQPPAPRAPVASQAAEHGVAGESSAAQPAHELGAASSGRSRTIVLWALWGGAGALAAATAVTGALALAANSDLSTQLAAFPGNADQIDQTRSRARAFGVASDVLLGVTVVTAGLALYVTLARPSSRSAADTSRSVEIGLGAGLGAGVGAAGVQLRGRY